MALRLLGRDVVCGAEDDAISGEGLRKRHLDDAEVRQLGTACLIQQDVLRLDVAMHEATGVRGVQRFADLRDDSHAHARRDSL